MDRIARKAETAIKYEEITRSKKFARTTTPDAISHATCTTARIFGPKRLLLLQQDQDPLLEWFQNTVPDHQLLQ